MLTGERLFAGETVTEVLAAVLKDPLRLDRLPPGIPASLRQLISRCLERDPRMRLRDIGEARIALSGVQTGEGSAPTLERASARHVVRPRPSRGARCARRPRAGGHRRVRRLAGEADGVDPGPAVRAAGGDGTGVGLRDFA